MAQQTPTALQTTYRLAIMVGTLACGSMAAYRYGPEPGRLAEMIDHAAGMIVEVPDAPEPASEPALFEPGEATLLAAEAPPAAEADLPRYDDAVQTASALAPVVRSQGAAPPAGSFDTLERERLVAPVLTAGATRADVQPWGRGESTMYRATASAPVGSAGSGLERRFDALGETPEAAVASLLDEVRSAPLR